MKKILSVLLTLCLFVNVSFAFDPYADEEVEKKSYKKLYYGIFLTLLGGFLAYDGFSDEEVDVSKPRVDYLTVSHSEWVQLGQGSSIYQFRSGISLNNVSSDSKAVDYTIYEIKNDKAPEGYDPNTDKYYNKDYFDRYSVEPNILCNTGNVDLKNIRIEVRYRYRDGTYVGKNGEHITYEGYYINTEGERVYVENQGYHIAGIKGIKEGEEVEGAVIDYYDENGQPVYISEKDERAKTYTYEDEKCSELEELKKGESITWQDVWGATTTLSSPPNGEERLSYYNSFINENDGNKDGESEGNNDGEGEGNEGNEGNDSALYRDGTEGLHSGNGSKGSPVVMEVRVKLEKNKNYTPIYEKRHKSDLEGVAGIFVGLTGIYFIVDHFVDLHKFNVYAKKHDLNLRFAAVPNGYKLMLQKRI